MNDRPNDLKRIRPEVPKAKVNDEMSDEERFQNTTLRPIVKLQNPLLIEVFKSYIIKRKNVFHNLTLEKRLSYIEDAVNKDMKFRNSLRGMIVGHFTLHEFLQYNNDSSAYNKRIANLVRERLISQVQLFDKPEKR